MKDQNFSTNQGKFLDSDITADGKARAHVALSEPDTLWFNTGTLCNITCANCYIESSPENDALVYISRPEVIDFLDQIETRSWPISEIGFTGGEPFMNPNIIAILGATLARGYDVLILTNAMRPMMRKRIQSGLVDLHRDYPDKLTLRISLDHYSKEMHDVERGKGSFDRTIEGMSWLASHGMRMAVAGRTTWGESDAQSRTGYAELFQTHGFEIDASNHGTTVLFPEMDLNAEVPEITTECWDILGKSQSDVMCSSSRMVVKRKGAEQPVVLACTLLAYDTAFEMGASLAEAEAPVQLNHPHCAKFCVLGGASCST